MAGAKKIEMIHVRLLPLTGYVGDCSQLGMKNIFRPSSMKLQYYMIIYISQLGKEEPR